MAEILCASSGHPHGGRISVEEFHRIAELGICDKRAELIRGVIFDRAAPPPLQRKLSKRLYDQIMGLQLVGYSVRHASPLTLQDSEPLPDVTVALGPDSDFEERHPSTAELVIEVALSSAALDREMVEIYAEAGVTEYWIVLAARRQVEVYRRPVADEYRERQLFAADEEIVCSAVPAIRISLATLFA
jgi:Uma2 family endonuclease